MSTVDAYTAAVALGVHVRTVRRWVGDGTLTNHGDERRIRVSLGELRTARTRRAIRACRLDTVSSTI